MKLPTINVSIFFLNLFHFFSAPAEDFLMNMEEIYVK